MNSKKPLEEEFAFSNSTNDNLYQSEHVVSKPPMKTDQLLSKVESLKSKLLAGRGMASSLLKPETEMTFGDLSESGSEFRGPLMKDI
jgi:hypothetical protein